MKIYIAKEDLAPFIVNGQNRIVTVFLKPGGQGKHNFRCIECGKIVFQYTGEASHVFDGAVIPSEKTTIDAMCHRCKIIYRVI